MSREGCREGWGMEDGREVNEIVICNFIRLTIMQDISILLNSPGMKCTDVLLDSSTFTFTGCY